MFISYNTEPCSKYYTAVYILKIKNMPKPYSDDLRWRLVWLQLFDGMSNVDMSSIFYLYRLVFYQQALIGLLACMHNSCGVGASQL